MKNYLIKENNFVNLKHTWYCFQIYRIKKINFAYQLLDLSFEIFKDWHYFNINILLFGDFFNLKINWTRKRDHAGFNLDICILGYSLLFYTYDTRHWDDDNDCFEGEIEVLHIKDFSQTPGLRYKKDSNNSAEEYYENILNPKFEECLNNKSKLKINLDKVAGYSPSFLDEIFGRLILDYGIKDVKNRVIIISTEEEHWIELIQKTYEEWEKKRKSI